MQKISIFTCILDKSSHFYSIFMKLKQFLYAKLLKNDVFKENLVKFGNHVEAHDLRFFHAKFQSTGSNGLATTPF